MELWPLAAQAGTSQRREISSHSRYRPSLASDSGTRSTPGKSNSGQLTVGRAMREVGQAGSAELIVSADARLRVVEGRLCDVGIIPLWPRVG